MDPEDVPAGGRSMTAVSVVDRRVGAAGQAVRDVAPLALPIAPFAMAVGAATAAADISLVAGWLGAAILLAGSAQLVLTETLVSGGGLFAAAGAAILVNARFAMYSAGFAHWFAEVPRWKRLLLAIPLVDQQFLLLQRTFTADHDVSWRVRYYVTASAVLVGAYLSFFPVGYLVGNILPSGVGLEMAGPLAFAGMLGSAVRRRADAVAAIGGAIVVVLASPVLAGLALPVAAVVGVAVGARLIGEEG